MKLLDLEKIVVESFSNLNSSLLEGIEENAIYSYNYKNEMIDEIEKVFVKIKSAGVSSLTVKKSKCMFCYPQANAYAFHNPSTDEFIIRYVISQDKDGMYRIEECKNKPIPDGENRMPF